MEGGNETFFPSFLLGLHRELEMWRGVMKGDCVPLTGDTPRIGAKRQMDLGISGKMQRDKLGIRYYREIYRSSGPHPRM